MKGWFGGVDDTARASSGQGWWSFTANNRDILIQLRQFDAGVIRLENLFDVESLLRQAVGAELAHANAVTPAASGEDECGNSIVFVVDAIDYEELFLQAQR